MRLINQLEISLDNLENTSGDIVFIGSQVDDRGSNVCCKLKKSKTINLYKFEFNAKGMTFMIGSDEISFQGLNKRLNELTDGLIIKNIILEATTLGVPEILYLLNWISKMNDEITIDIIYAEPEDYPSRTHQNSDFGKHQFKLSNYSVGYKSLPGFTKTVPSNNKSHLIALLGFERVRLGQLLQNDEGAYINMVTPIYGVPSFRPSYDKHSVFQNVNLLKTKGDLPCFASANNPFNTLSLLSKLQKSMPNSIINIAPIGTKPMAIGACLFAINNLNGKVGIMYDHPIKSRNRTNGISKIHKFRVKNID